MITSFLGFLVLVLIIKYIWERRWIYYYGSKIPGPRGIPFVAPFKLISANSANVYKKSLSICQSQPPVYKHFLGQDLVIVNSKPEELDILLNTYLDKPQVYEVPNEYFKDSLITAPVNIWKNHRRIIRRSFNSKTLALSHEIFVEYSKQIVTIFTQTSGKEASDKFILDEIWKCIFDSSLKSLVDIDPNAVKGRFDKMKLVVRGEEIIIERMLKFWLLNPLIWYFSRMRQEVLSLKKIFHTEIKKVIDEAKKTHKRYNNCDLKSDFEKEIGNKRFLPYLFNLRDDEVMTDEQITEELKFMLLAASETTAVTLMFTILLLGLYPEIQDNIFQEISSQWETGNGELSPESTNQLNYTERVLKETLRLFPPVPMISRSIDKTMKLGEYTYPAGSQLMVVIGHLHRRPDLWPDPLKFDPDRFLPENVTKRHRCAFMPFSYGSRNCLGLHHALKSLRIMLVYIVKNFHIKAVNYHSVEDIAVEYRMILAPKNNRVVFETRQI